MPYEEERSDKKGYDDRRRRRREILIPNQQAPLREQLREVMRFLRYSRRTEDAYWHWTERFLRHHRRAGQAGPVSWRHPRDMGAREVAAFLTHLGAVAKVSASTQN